jgi:hypothetical protein
LASVISVLRVTCDPRFPMAVLPWLEQDTTGLVGA